MADSVNASHESLVLAGVGVFARFVPSVWAVCPWEDSLDDAAKRIESRRVCFGCSVASAQSANDASLGSSKRATFFDRNARNRSRTRFETPSFAHVSSALARPHRSVANSCGANRDKSPGSNAHVSARSGKTPPPPPARPYPHATLASSFGLSWFKTDGSLLSKRSSTSEEGASPNRVSAQNAMVISYGLNVAASEDAQSPFPISSSSSAGPPQNLAAAASRVFRSAGGARRPITANAQRTFATPCGSSSDARAIRVRSSASQNAAPGSRSARASDHVTLDAAHPERSGSNASVLVSSARYHAWSSSVPRWASRRWRPRRLYAVATFTSLKRRAS
mmetsp:Transcript_234/g.950  ORF Transcript_234/g.950 Transcript_234/m.950 type:complete len:335 (-) Transcript_234:136-1140(-)